MTDVFPVSKMNVSAEIHQNAKIYFIFRSIHILKNHDCGADLAGIDFKLSGGRVDLMILRRNSME